MRPHTTGGKQALFLDRDGILNRIVEREGAISSPWSLAEFQLLEGASQLVSCARTLGLLRVVVTNQPDVARGNLSIDVLEEMHLLLARMLPIDAIEVCTSGDDADPRRKPNPGMLLESAARLDIDLPRSFLVGDSPKDLLAGKRAGVLTILLETNYNRGIHGSGDRNCRSHDEIVSLLVSILNPTSRLMSFSQDFLQQVARVASSLDHGPIEAMVRILRDLRENNGRLFIIGSGGGAGHASHATCDFRKLAGIQAICPMDNVSELTARINDEGWDRSIADSLKLSQINEHDALFVFSVGGGSEASRISVNLVEAVKTAKQRNAVVLGVVGRDGGYTASVADACVVVPTVEPGLVTPLTESYQAVVWHLIVSHPDLQRNPAKWESSS